MALVYRTKTEKYLSDCKKLKITDITGNYNQNNPTGWGKPNTEKSDVTYSEVAITYPDGTILEPIVLSEGEYLFPSVNSTIYLQFTESLIDGIYKLIFSLENETGEDLGISTEYYLSTCNIDCCMAKYSTKVQGCCGNCDNILDKWSEMREYYDAILWQFECGNYDSATDLLAKLTKLCSSTNCGC